MALKTLKKSDLIEMVIQGMLKNTVHLGNMEKDAERIVDNYLTTDLTNEPWWAADVISHLNNRQKLAGVKIIRESTGISISEAKEAVEYYMFWGTWSINENGTKK